MFICSIIVHVLVHHDDHVQYVHQRTSCKYDDRRASPYFGVYSLSLRRLLMRPLLPQTATALVLSRLDYCLSANNAGLPASTLSRLQRIFHASARLIYGVRKNEHISFLYALKQLYVSEKIDMRLGALALQCSQSQPQLIPPIFSSKSPPSLVAIDSALQIQGSLLHLERSIRRLGDGLSKVLHPECGTVSKLLCFPRRTLVLKESLITTF